MNQKLRCACGKSKKMPWCDGSHKNDDWACENVIEPQIKRAFLGAPDLLNLVKRLAWRFDGEVINATDKLSGQQLVIVEDGSTLATLQNTLKHLNFAEIYYVGVDFPTQVIAQALQFKAHIQVSDLLNDSFVTLESAIERWFAGDFSPHPSLRQQESIQADEYRCEVLKRVFISHAVADETFLLPVVASIRQVTQLDVFLCFDSINEGEKWRRQIDAALEQCELFIFIVSKASINSTYCAFETGCAISKDKRIVLISIDGSLPPAYISQLHCIDLQREINAKPWLDLKAALMAKVLEFTQESRGRIKGSEILKRKFFHI
ncbi:MAG: TIR domain-containing protein [Algicola sp.]|nr:TIR domain-containing protein [Algicola sp.]